jgi:hypothetical protein
MPDNIKYPYLEKLIQKYGKSSKQIADEVKEFCEAKPIGKILLSNPPKVQYSSNPEFYGYFSAYDWVCMCQLFGKMINLPEGFPWYCNDLQQRIANWTSNKGEIAMRYKGNVITNIKEHVDYPAKVNAHNALADAKWNKGLHEFLKNITCGK